MRIAAVRTPWRGAGGAESRSTFAPAARWPQQSHRDRIHPIGRCSAPRGRRRPCKRRFGKGRHGIAIPRIAGGVIPPLAKAATSSGNFSASPIDRSEDSGRSLPPPALERWKVATRASADRTGLCGSLRVAEPAIGPVIRTTVLNNSSSARLGSNAKRARRTLGAANRQTNQVLHTRHDPRHFPVSAHRTI